MDPLQELLTQLKLQAQAPDNFVGQSRDLGWGRVYGGQVLAQALMAAHQSIERRILHSLHAYFIRPGDPSQDVEYQVERVRDGGSFSVRRVLALQKNEVILILSCSFQIPESGFSHETPMPQVAGPEGLRSELEMRRANINNIPENLRDKYTRDVPFEVRPIDPIDPFKPMSEQIRPPQKYSWMRAVGRMPDDPSQHKALLAYMSDWGILGASLLPHGVSGMSKQMQVASLDHAMWFHRDFRADNWLLYSQESPSASQGRGFSRGHFFSQDGRLVASVCQEGLIRLRT